MSVLPDFTSNRTVHVLQSFVYPFYSDLAISTWLT